MFNVVWSSVPFGNSFGLALYDEIEPQTDTRPKFFILYITALLKSPPTCNLLLFN